ncbi:MAG: DUF3549 family protein [gamma proteobacterium symbiont of Bathyaustriella thionipta]|nr:DUF3549 family protein [gamma proteobacterium symbiont of Bathyaustriella thionipta]
MDTLNPSCLHSLFERGGLDCRLWEMGRRVQPLAQDFLLRFERDGLAYPFPLQRKACLALILSSPVKNEQANIWFLQLPLDELGSLQLSARDYLLERMLESFLLQGENSSPDGKDPLQDNPLAFQPGEEKRAIFHALYAASLHQPPSSQYSRARQYFSSDSGWDQWSFLGFQGIADICARLSEEDNDALLTAAIEHLPAEPLYALASCLENSSPSSNLSNALALRLQQESGQAQMNTSIWTACVRALSAAPANIQQSAFKRLLLNTQNIPQDVLIALSAKAWATLQNEQLALLWLEHLSRQPQAVFNTLLADLMFIPGMRAAVMAAMRNPQRSEKLATAFQQLLQAHKSGD